MGYEMRQVLISNWNTCIWLCGGGRFVRTIFLGFWYWSKCRNSVAVMHTAFVSHKKSFRRKTTTSQRPRQRDNKRYGFHDGTTIIKTVFVTRSLYTCIYCILISAEGVKIVPIFQTEPAFAGGHQCHLSAAMHWLRQRGEMPV